MGSGNHNDNGRSPSPVCAYLRDLAGWCDNEIDLSTAAAVEARHGDYNTVMKFRTSKPNEYFLVENRSRIGLDRGLPASGLAVYHCDTLGSNELQQGTAAKHYQCALLQADGRRDLELDANQGDGDDLFGAIQGVALSATSTPEFARVGRPRFRAGRFPTSRRPAEIIKFKVGGGDGRAVVAGGRGKPDADPSPTTRRQAFRARSQSPNPAPSRRSRSKVDIQHTYIGDLRVALTSPSGRSTVLHPQLGGSADNLVATYDSAVPGSVLSSMVGQPMMGNWTLNVSDRARADVGKLRSWSIELRSAPVGSNLVAVLGVRRRPRGTHERVVNDSRLSPHASSVRNAQLARRLPVGDALHAVLQQSDDAPLEIDALDAVEFDLGAVVPGKDLL